MNIYVTSYFKDENYNIIIAHKYIEYVQMTYAYI